MPWNSGIPQPAQTISETTGDIQGNFAAVQTWTVVDHVQIDGLLGDEGKHNKVTLMNQAAAPPFTPVVVPATGVSALGLYALAGPLPATTNPANATTQLYAHVVRKLNDAAITWTTSEIPFSYSILTQVRTPDNTFATSTTGYTYLPSGIIMKWGVSNVNGLGFSFLQVQCNGAGLGPNFTKILNVQLTNRQSASMTRYNNVVSISAMTDTTFTVEIQNGESTNLSATTRVSWLCIGY
jgi:hypothetical protein